MPGRKDWTSTRKINEERSNKKETSENRFLQEITTTPERLRCEKSHLYVKISVHRSSRVKLALLASSSRTEGRQRTANKWAKLAQYLNWNGMKLDHIRSELFSVQTFTGLHLFLKNVVGCFCMSSGVDHVCFFVLFYAFSMFSFW